MAADSAKGIKWRHRIMKIPYISTPQQLQNIKTAIILLKCKVASMHANAKDMSHIRPAEIVKQPMCVIILGLRNVQTGEASHSAETAGQRRRHTVS